jgi:hypothetical protein
MKRFIVSVIAVTLATLTLASGGPSANAVANAPAFSAADKQSTAVAKVYWRYGYRYRPYRHRYYGYHRPYRYYGYRPYWRPRYYGYYRPRYYGYYRPYRHYGYYHRPYRYYGYHRPYWRGYGHRYYGRRW